jgi:type I restriction enzyme S subunit
VSQTAFDETTDPGLSLPAGWTVRRLKTVLLEPLKYGANEAADSDDPDDPRFVRITDIAEDGGLKPDTFRSLPMSIAQPYLLDEGDLLLARSGATVGKSFMYSQSWGPCCFAGYLIRARPDTGKVLPQYLRYFSESRLYWQHIASEQIQATIQNVSADRYGNLPVPMPEVVEQRAVVEFLDREIVKIDALIGKQEQLIATLREDRTATITHAVTRGLEPDALMKDTRVVWLPQIPAGWEIRPVKSYGKLITGKTPPSEDLTNFCDDGLPWIRPQDIHQHTGITVPSAGISQSGLKYINRIPAASVLVCCIGAGSIGKIGYSQFAACTNQQITAIAGAPSPQYLFYLMLAAKDQVLSFAAINRLPIINNERLGSIQVPFPTLAEMTKIANYLDRQCGKVDKLISQATAVIVTLREYRSALITDAVTGKIDVRRAA